MLEWEGAGACSGSIRSGMWCSSVEECIDYDDNRDWRRRCSDRAERGGSQETVIFGSEHGLVDPKA